MYSSTATLTDPSGNLPDELLYGRVGCLYALLFVKQTCKEKIHDDLISSIVNAIILSGKNLSEKMRQGGFATPPLMFEWHEQKYLGPAHGIAGILYLLLQVSRKLVDFTVTKF